MCTDHEDLLPDNDSMTLCAIGGKAEDTIPLPSCKLQRQGREAASTSRCPPRHRHLTTPFPPRSQPEKVAKLPSSKQMAADTTPSTALLTMKLLVDSRPLCRRVVFAEAGKDAVDFLFSLLSMPAGTAVKLLGKESMVGSMGNLYASVQRLDDAYVQPGAAKDALLCPAVLSPAASPNGYIFRLPEPPSSSQKSFFTCSTHKHGYGNSGCYNYVTDARGTRCPSCKTEMMESKYQYVPPASGGAGQAQNAAKGFVRAAVTYKVTDDLMITPISAISCITRLSAFPAGNLGALQEKTVQLGHKEGLEILRASLQSKTVLTDVFLGKKPPFIEQRRRFVGQR